MPAGLQLRGRMMTVPRGPEGLLPWRRRRRGPDSHAARPTLTPTRTSRLGIPTLTITATRTIERRAPPEPTHSTAC